MAMAIQRLNLSKMKEQEEIAYINKHKRQARQLHPNSMVVPVERAKAAISRAYRAGVNVGVDVAMAATKDKDAINPIFSKLSPEDYE